VAAILQKVQEVQKSNKLLTMPFTTIFEYLQVRKIYFGCMRRAVADDSNPESLAVLLFCVLLCPAITSRNHNSGVPVTCRQ
jgi:hypothetical protein